MRQPPIIVWRYLFSWAALCWPTRFLRAATRRPSLWELGAPQFPLMILAIGVRIRAGLVYPHTDLMIVPLTVLYALWSILVAALGALACVRLAARWCRTSLRAPDGIAIAICGAYALAPWSFLQAIDATMRILGGAGWISTGTWVTWLDWYGRLPSGGAVSASLVSPGRIGFWLYLVAGLAVTAMGLWRAVPQVEARVRGRFLLLWAFALVLLLSFVCGVV